MNTLKLLCLSAVLAAFSAPALAANECDRYTTDYDRTYCMAKLSAASDTELNNVYKDLRKVIDSKTKKQLVSVQKDWIAHRDNLCSESGSINVDCNYRLTKERTDYLRDRLRECNTGTCRKDAILEPSW